MKKSLLFISITLLSIALVACSNNKDKTTEESKPAESTTVETSENQEETATFRGKITEIPVLDEDVVRLIFDELEAVNDPDGLLDSFNASGVVLLAGLDSFDKDIEQEDIVAGSELEFVIETPAAMTFSIPPQVSGNSIITIRQIK